MELRKTLEFQIHVVVLGEPGCGKSAFVERLRHGDFARESKVYFGTQPCSKFQQDARSLSGQNIKANFITYEANVVEDTHHRTVLDMTKFPEPSKIDIVLLLFDLTKRKGIQNAVKQLAQFKKKLQKYHNTIGQYKFPCLLIGTKALSRPRRTPIKAILNARLPFLQTDAYENMHILTVLKVIISMRLNKNIYDQWRVNKQGKRPKRQTVTLVFNNTFVRPTFYPHSQRTALKKMIHMENNVQMRFTMLPDEPELHILSPPPPHQQTQIEDDYIIL